LSIKFYDTNALLNLQEKCFEEFFICSSKTLEEIEHIKVSDKKDQEIKYRARKLAKLIKNNHNLFEIIVPSNLTFEILKDFQLEVNHDNIIMACAYDYNKNSKEIDFISEDICCLNIARKIFGLTVKSLSDLNSSEDVEYTGYKEITISDDEMSYFYNNSTKNN